MGINPFFRDPVSLDQDHDLYTGDPNPDDPDDS